MYILREKLEQLKKRDKLSFKMCVLRLKTNDKVLAPLASVKEGFVMKSPIKIEVRNNDFYVSDWTPFTNDEFTWIDRDSIMTINEASDELDSLYKRTINEVKTGTILAGATVH